MKHSFKQKNTGFSLLETLLAVSILMIAVVGPMTLAWSSLSAAQDEKNETTATYLAQEAIEYIKNVRDMNTLSSTGNSWLTSLTTCLDQNCGIDISGTTLGQNFIQCSMANNDCKLYLRNDGIYTHVSSSGPLTPFSRVVKILQIPGPNHPDERLIIVSVKWKNRSFDRVITTTDVMYNYQQ